MYTYGQKIKTHEALCSQKRSQLEQLEAEQYPCGECDYVAKHLNNLKRHKLTYLLGDIKMYFTPQIAYDESGRVSM